jgi:hypothetical protein
LQSIPNPENLDMGWVDLIDRIDALVMGRIRLKKFAILIVIGQNVRNQRTNK